MEEPYSTRIPLVFDTSAWNRQDDRRVKARWIATLDAELIVACPAVTLEVLRGAPDEARRGELDSALTDLAHRRNAPITGEVCAMALSASRELRGDRRGIPALDVLIAAAATARGFGVLHDDRHFDRLSRVLGFESVRV